MVDDQSTDFLPSREIIAKTIRNGKLFENKSKYEPPYDSPIEDIFAWNLGKYINPNLRLDKQIEANTPWGIFILDFMVECKSEKIAFECDGKDFHDLRRDEWRDAIILGEGYIDTIYHLRGTDLIHRTEDCFFIISLLDPQIVGERGRVNLEALASDSIKLDFELKFGKNTEEVNGLISLGIPEHFIYIVRNTRNMPDGKSPLWKCHYSYALENRGLALDNLIGKYLKEVDSRIME